VNRKGGKGRGEAFSGLNGVDLELEKQILPTDHIDGLQERKFRGST
jgi:hypothetical protein